MAIVPEGTIEGLAEVVLRVRDLDAMQAFYRDVVGLTVWRRFGDDMTFFKLAEGSDTRPQTLALFTERWPSNVPDAPWAGLASSTTTLHHFALSISLTSLTTVKTNLASARVPTVERTFSWAGWRSLMISDPEGNVVELVALDPGIQAESQTDPRPSP